MRTLKFMIFATIVASLVACDDARQPTLGTPISLEIPAATSADGPRLSSGPDGELALSWMEPADDGPALRYSMLGRDGFEPARHVVSDPAMFVNWADLPGVMHVAGDHWIAHWLSSSAEHVYAYGVVVSQSFDGGASWSEPLLAHTDGTDTEHGFVSLHRDEDGVALLWLDGRNTPGGPMTLRSAVITPDGARAHEQVVDDSVCDCCQTDVAISAAGPVAVYRDRTREEIRDIYVTRYLDDAWQPGQRLHADEWEIAGCPVNGPSIVADGGNVAVAWFTAAHGEPVVRLSRSTDSGETFAAPVEIATGSLAGYVGLAQLPDGSLAVSWVSRSPDNSNQVNLQLVDASGKQGPALVIADTGQLRLFPQLAYADGSLYLVWTDRHEDGPHLAGARIPVH